METLQGNTDARGAVHSSPRILELDGVRGIACLSVMLWHYFCSGGPIQVGMGGWDILGWSGVDLFFVLSGFLISGILFDNVNSPNYFRTFYIRRLCRIFPVYYVVILSFVIGGAIVASHPACNLWLLKDSMPAYSYATFTQNFFMAGTHPPTAGAKWLAMTWSVAVEEHFYMLFPLVVWLVPMARLRFLILGAIVAAPVLRVLSGACGIWFYALLPCRVDALAVGVFAAYLVRQPIVLAWLRENRAMFYFALACCALGFSFFRADNLGYTWIALFYGLFILLVVVHPQTLIAGLCRNRFLGWVGLISYGLYMYHQPVNGFFHALLLNQAPRATSGRMVLVTLLSMGVSFTLAAVSFYGMERWLLQLGHRARWFPAVEAGEKNEPAPPTLAKAA